MMKNKTIGAYLTKGEIIAKYGESLWDRILIDSYYYPIISINGLESKISEEEVILSRKVSVSDVVDGFESNDYKVNEEEILKFMDSDFKFCAEMINNQWFVSIRSLVEYFKDKGKKSEDKLEKKYYDAIIKDITTTSRLVKRKNLYFLSDLFTQEFFNYVTKITIPEPEEEILPSNKIPLSSMFERKIRMFNMGNTSVKKDLYQHIRKTLSSKMKGLCEAIYDDNSHEIEQSFFEIIRSYDVNSDCCLYKLFSNKIAPILRKSSNTIYAWFLKDSNINPNLKIN